MTHVLVADGHSFLRVGLKLYLNYSLDDMTVGTVDNQKDTLHYLENNDVDIVILDIQLPPAGGLQTLKQIRQKNGNLPVLILSVNPEHDFAMRAFKSGAAGFLSIDLDVKELITAIQTALNGKKYVSTALAERLAGEVFGSGDYSPHERLSDREFEIFRLLANGQTPTVIAEHLNLSPKTVDTHRRNILEKMQLRTNSDLIRYAMKHNLVD